MNDSTKYGRITSSVKEFPENEPIFLLRAQDEFASAAVCFYAETLRKAGYDPAVVTEILDFASMMEEWPTKKRPD